MCLASKDKMTTPWSATLHRRRTVSSLVIACVGASLVSFFIGKAFREEFFQHQSQEHSMKKQLETSKSSTGTLLQQQAEFVWISSNEESDSQVEGGGDDEDDDDDEDTHHHLTMNLKNISHRLIDSQEALFNLMETIAEKFDLDLIAHGCQAMPHGACTRCLGLLEAGHISLYAWPENSVLLFDLYVLEDEIDINNAEELSEIFEQDMAENIIPGVEFDFGTQSMFAIRQRGGRDEVSDYDIYVEFPSDLKKKVGSVQSPFQKIDVVDFFDKFAMNTLMDALEKDEEYVLNNPEFFKPDRTLFLDGVVQSTREGNAAYHESLVQPAMFAHDNPKRVAIVGGGECATLREVLKHNTIDKVFMIEIDEVIVEASKQFLPDWNDCSNFEGSSRYCMDDERANVMHEDAFKWFIDRFGANPIEEEDPFDVIILDALDPQNVVDFAEALYGDSSFMSALYNGLSEDGVLVSQVGEAVKLDDPAQTYSVNRNRALFINSLTAQGFVNIAEYNEGRAMFEAPWTFNVAFKSMKSRNNWDDNEAAVTLKMKKRSIGTLDGESPFEYFDGADMQVRLPTRASEVVFCRQEPTPVGCEGGHGFDPSKVHVQRSKTNDYTCGDVKDAVDGDSQDGTDQILEDAVRQVSFETDTLELLSKAREHDVLKTTSRLYLDARQKIEALKFNLMEGASGPDAFILPHASSSNATKTSGMYLAGPDYVYNPALSRNPPPYLAEVALSAKENLATLQMGKVCENPTDDLPSVSHDNIVS